MTIRNKTILITGGGSGIGRALAILLADAGNQVLICGRTKAALHETGTLAKGKIGAIVVADIVTDSGRAAIVQAVANLGSPLDILINNAGVQYAMDLTPGEAEEDLADRVTQEVNINLVAPILLTADLLRHMPSPGGTVVNVTSLLALHPKPSSPIYCATKAGLRSFTRSLRSQWVEKGINVVEAIPPLVSTSMSEGRGYGKISPKQAAKEIVKGLSAGKSEIRIGKSSIVFILNRLAPSFVERLLAKG